MARPTYFNRYGCWPRLMGLAIAGALVWISVSVTDTNAAELECPQSNDLYTPPLAAEIDGLLPKGLALEQAGKLATAITLMLEHGLTTKTANNHLVALYCPVIVAETGLSGLQKLQRVRDSAAETTRLALARNGVEDIIFDVP